MPNSDILRDMAKRAKISELFSPLSYDEKSKLYLLDGGRIGYAVHYTPHNGGDDSTHNQIQALLNSKFREDTFIQFMMWKSPDAFDLIQNIKNKRMDLWSKKDPTSKALENSYNKRIDFLTKGTSEPIERKNNTRVCDVKGMVFVIFEPKKSKKSFLSGGVEAFKEKDLVEIDNIISGFVAGLDSIGLNPRFMVPYDLIRIYQTILCWGDTPVWKDGLYSGEDQDKFIREYFTPEGYMLENDGDQVILDSGKKIVRTYSVNKFPEQAGPSVAAFFLGNVASGHSTIPNNVLFNCTIYYKNKDELKSNFDRKRYLINKQAFSSMLSSNPILARHKIDFDDMQASLDNGDTAIQVMFTVALFSDTQQEAKDAGVSLKQYFLTNELQFSLVDDAHISLPLFLNNLPFGVEKKAVSVLDRFRTMTTKHVTRVLPIQADWRGNSADGAVINLISRNGQLMNLDLFDSNSSYNAIVVGESGGGKSFFVNELVNSYLQTGAQVWIIDAGRSYKKMCDVFHGDFMEFTPDANISLNPFDIADDDNDEINLLVGIIFAMATERQFLDDFQTARLGTIIREGLNEHKTKFSIDLLIDLLANDEDKDINRIAAQLDSFSSDGDYGKWFSGKNTIDFKNQLTVLELEELSGHHKLQQAVLFQLISQIESIIYKAKQEEDRCYREGVPYVPTKKVVVIDEAWALLTEGSDVKTFIESAYRKFRKYGASIVVISQSISDMFKDSSSQAIVTNSPFKFLLKMQDAAVEAMRDQKYLPLQPYEYNMIKSLNMAKGQYSEVYCVTSDYGNGVGRHVVDYYHQLLYTTKKEEVTALNKIKHSKEGLTMHDAIVIYAKNQGRPVE